MTVGRITFGPAADALASIPWNGPRRPDGTPYLESGSVSAAQYVPDPAEEAWHASPDGKRAAARQLRERAARDLAEAERLEKEAADAG